MTFLIFYIVIAVHVFFSLLTEEYIYDKTRSWDIVVIGTVIWPMVILAIVRHEGFASLYKFLTFRRM